MSDVTTPAPANEATPVPAEQTAGRPQGDITPRQALRIEVEQLKVEIANEKTRIDGERVKAEEEFVSAGLVVERDRLKAELAQLRESAGAAESATTNPRRNR